MKSKDDNNRKSKTNLSIYDGISPFVAKTANYHWYSGEGKKETKYYYSRGNNPNYEALEEKLVEIHNGKKAVVFASGMAAISAVLFSFCPKRSTIFLQSETYGETQACICQFSRITDCEIVKLDLRKLDYVKNAIEKADNVSMLFCESASNPSGQVPDLKKLINLVKSKFPDCLIVVDNTFITPYNFKPLDYGADVVIESITKYLNGRGDLIMGAAIIKMETSAKSGIVRKRLKSWRSLHGGVPTPENCVSVIKSLETFPLRMERINNTARIIAEFLEKLKCVTRVLYVGIESHPSYETGKQQFKGGSGIIYFHLPVNENIANEIHRFPFKTIIAATSYGEAHTLLRVPAEGYSNQYELEPDIHTAIPGHWFRLAIGLEDQNVIIADLLSVLRDYFLTSIGKVSHYYSDLEVVECKYNSLSECPDLTKWDIVFYKNKNSIFEHFEIVDIPRIKEKEGIIIYSFKTNKIINKNRELFFLQYSQQAL